MHVVVGVDVLGQHGVWEEVLHSFVLPLCALCTRPSGCAKVSVDCSRARVGEEVVEDEKRVPNAAAEGGSDGRSPLVSLG